MMHRWLTIEMKKRLMELNGLSNPNDIFKKLIEIKNILEQTGPYKDFNEPELDYVIELLNNPNLTVVKYAIIVINNLNYSNLLPRLPQLINKIGFLKTDLYFQYNYLKNEDEQYTLFNHIFNEEDHRIRWEFMLGSMDFEEDIKYTTENFFNRLIHKNESAVNQLIAYFYFALINPSVQLEKLLKYINELPEIEQNELDIIELIALNLYKTKSKITADTFISLYEFYINLRIPKKYYNFFIQGYIDLLSTEQTFTDAINIFNRFSMEHQKTIASKVIKDRKDQMLIKQFLDCPDLSKDIISIFENGYDNLKSSEFDTDFDIDKLKDSDIEFFL